MSKHNNFQCSTSLQDLAASDDDVLYFPLRADGFVQDSIKERTIDVDIGIYGIPHLESRRIVTLIGHLSDQLCEEFDREYRTCPHCQAETSRHTSFSVTLPHLTWVDNYIKLKVKCLQRRCPVCGRRFRQTIPFKHPKHLVTMSAFEHVISLIRTKHNLKQISIITGVDCAIAADLAKEYLKEKS